MQSVGSFFGVTPESLRWSHPAWDAASFQAACLNPVPHLLRVSAHLGAQDAVPHLGTTTNPSALDVLSALALAQAHNKGLKLELHGADCVHHTLANLPKHLTTPLVLQADLFDLLDDPHSPTSVSSPASFFHIAARACPGAVLCLNWQLSRTQDADGRLETGLLDQLAGLLTGPQLAQLGQAYGVEFRTGNRLAQEWGGILLLDPLEHAPQPLASQHLPDTSNVVSLAQYRRAA